MIIQPTPIQKSNNKINNNNIFVKREDLLPFSFGGNKARKAILFFDDILSKKCDYILTYGSSSSNHCRIIANMAASKRIPCSIITPEETSNPTSNSKIVELFGSKVIKCKISEVASTIDKTMEKLKSQGYNPYFIQGGGHGNIGTQAYVNAYNEIKDYEDRTGVFFDYIFHTTGTGTTQAGLICGKLLNGDQRMIIGISNARRNPYGEQVVLDSVKSYMKSVRKGTVTLEEVSFIDEYVLDGYGSYNKEILQTIKEVLIQDGIPMDTTYTGKCFWGMKEYIKKNNITDKNILFIHTGGTPLFFDKLGELI